MIEFKKRNRVTCIDESMYSVILNYICWVLGGKPDGKVKDGKFNERQ